MRIKSEIYPKLYSKRSKYNQNLFKDIHMCQKDD